MIEINNLSKEFSGFTAVDDISFSVGEGEVLGFLGPNGAGKSTTMKMLSGFLRPSSGSARVMGHDVVRRPLAAKREIGYLPEGAPLYADMTAPDFLHFIARMRGLRGKNRVSAVDKVIQQLELGSVAAKRIDELSKGYKRRVGIAQAIVHDPAVLILDEPTDGLDPNQKHQVRKLIRNLSAEKIVILSTHILEEVSAVCTRAVVIADGKLVADQTPAELQSRSRYHQAVTIDLSDEQDLHRVRSALEKVPTIKTIESLAENPGRLTAIPEAGLVIHKAIADVLTRDGIRADSVFIETGRLEDVFRDITAGKDPAGLSPGAVIGSANTGRANMPGAGK